MNGTIGKQMVDTLVESASNVEVSHWKGGEWNWSYINGGAVVLLLLILETTLAKTLFNHKHHAKMPY